MIYADYNGSSPLSKRVKEYLLKRIENGPFANPNAAHSLGRKINDAIEKSREICGFNLGADPFQIIFNSCSTEGANSVFNSVLKKAKEAKKTIILISEIEHPAIKQTAYSYELEGFSVKKIPISNKGVVCLNSLNDLINKYENQIALACVMSAHNETGILQPIVEISSILKKTDIPFLCDTTQMIGKIPFHFKNSKIDYALISGHKFGSLIGTGILLIKDPTNFTPQMVGGGQENGMRHGTQNYIGIESLAVALNSMRDDFLKLSNLSEKRDQFENQLCDNFSDIVIIGKNSPRLPTTSYISYSGLFGPAIQIELESNGIFISTSSACSDSSQTIPAVLKAMGYDEMVGRSTVRISLGPESELDSYDIIFEALSKTYNKLKKLG